MDWQYLADLAYTLDSLNEVFRPNRIKARAQYELVDHVNKISCLKINVPQETFSLPVNKPKKAHKRRSGWGTIASVVEPEMIKRLR